MNFLAHLYLSRNNEEIMVGNILGDFMKGRKPSDFSTGIQEGIHLHRAIDAFTDSHSVVNTTKERLRPLFGHYSPVVADIFFDHILAVNWNQYSDESLHDFSKKAYHFLQKHKNLFPLRFQHALLYMRFRNLLVSYSKIKGIQFAFDRITGRSLHKPDFGIAVSELRDNYDLYRNDFMLFFPQLIQHLNTNKFC